MKSLLLMAGGHSPGPDPLPFPTTDIWAYPLGKAQNGLPRLIPC